MTEIDELEGRALDVAICEAREWVFAGEGKDADGQLLTEHWRSGVETTAYFIRQNGEVVAVGKEKPPHSWLPRGIYEPHRNLAQAWELMEALVADDWYPYLVMYAVTASGDKHDWECSFERGTEHFATGDTAPEAICRAYLKAKGDDQDNA